MIVKQLSVHHIGVNRHDLSSLLYNVSKLLYQEEKHESKRKFTNYDDSNTIIRPTYWCKSELLYTAGKSLYKKDKHE